MTAPSATTQPHPNLLSVLRFRNFTLLWAGQAISQLGDNLFSVALMWLVLQLTGSALALGAIPILAMLPRIAFQLVGGAWVDRYDRRLLMMASDAIRGMVMLVLALLVATGQIQLIYIYVLQVIFGIVSGACAHGHRAANGARRCDWGENGLCAGRHFGSGYVAYRVDVPRNPHTGLVSTTCSVRM